jgi:hypothetical protein
MKTLNEMLDDVILNNELSGVLAAAYRFSHASSGKSGWSFGRCQFDVKNNSAARALLSKLGFTTTEVLSIQDETMDPRRWNARLLAGSATIDQADTAQLSYCLDQAMNFAINYGVPVQSPGGVLALADYANQYGAPGAQSAAFYKALGHPVTPDDVLYFKLHDTEYGGKDPADCKRRYAGVMAVLKAA